jgi:iron complex transport system ATP-binding protein
VRLSVEEVSVTLGDSLILDRVSLTVQDGQFAALVGPNGSGKTTLLRTIYRAVRPDAGRVLLDGRDVWLMSAAEAARYSGVLVQQQHSGFEFTVAEMVALGRTPHLGVFDRFRAADWEVVAEAMARAGLTRLRNRRMDALSGGERQRVLLARALAQQPRLLVLDEPTNHLDIRHQLELLEMVRGLGITVLAALHKLDLAAGYCDEIVVLDGGRVVANGTPGETLTPETLRQVFGVDGRVDVDIVTGRPVLAVRPLCVCPRKPCHWSCLSTGDREAQRAT